MPSPFLRFTGSDPVRRPDAQASTAWSGRLFAALLLFLPVLFHCGSPVRLRHIPIGWGLPETLAIHLERDSPAAFREFTRRADPRTLQLAFVSLLRIPSELPQAFLETESRLRPYAGRLATTLRDELDLQLEARTLARYEAMPVADRRAVSALLKRIFDVITNPPADLNERARRYEELVRDTREYASVLNPADPYSMFCELLPRLNRRAEMPAHLEAAAGYSLEFGDTTMACQFLGMLGSYYQQSGDIPLMTVYWNRAMELARADGNWHEARILSFWANFHYARNDPARGIHFLRQAEERARALNLVAVEARMLQAKLTMFARMQCWDLVARELPRADALLRRGPAWWNPEEKQHWQMRFLVLRMQTLTSRGDRKAAIRAAREVIRRTRGQTVSPTRQIPLIDAARTLIAAGRPGEGLELIESVIRECEQLTVPELLKYARLERGWAQVELGDTAAAARWMAEAVDVPRPEMYGSEWARLDALRARLLRLASDRRGAAAALAAALREVEATRRNDTRSTESQIVLAVAEPLRREFHLLAADDPAAGYLFELAWSSLRLSGHRRCVVFPSEIAARVAEGAPLGLPLLDDRDIHAVYRWEEDAVIRWTRMGDLVRRAIVTGNPDDLRRKVESMMSDLTLPDGADRPPAGRRLRQWHALAERLLPPETGTPGRRFLVQRDGPLAALPFEALSLDARTYRPLLLEHDVAAVPWPRTGNGVASPLPARPLIVTSPEYHPELRRRWSILNEPTPASDGEVVGFGAGAEAPTRLDGAAATVPAVLAAMTRADEIDIAGHFVADDALPYIEYIPLAPDSTGTGLLGTADIRGLDLRNCRLVVLSGCGTGAGRSVGNVSIASLADVFFEAGARHVIATGWNVRDADAAAVMRAFNERRAAGITDPVAALAEARRRLIRANAPPRVWAAFTILTDDLDPVSASGAPLEAGR
jgi:hypothetical protein